MFVELDNLAVEDFDKGFSETTNPYLAQTFVAEGYGLYSVSYMIDAIDGGDLKYNVLITTVKEDATGFHPDRVLKEVSAPTIPVEGAPELQLVTIDLSGLRLDKGETYAIVFEIVPDGASDGSGLGYNDNYSDGQIYISKGDSGRAADFAAPWGRC